MPATLNPPVKRRRLDASDENSAKIRKDVFTVFQLWRQVHFSHDNGTALGNGAKLQELSNSHVAARCALALSLPRILQKVDLDFNSKLKVVVAVFVALSDCPEKLKQTAVQAVIPVLRELVCNSLFDIAADDTFKELFKSLVLSFFILSSQLPTFQEQLVHLSTCAFQCRPYWFIIALTDALEDESHPALSGAVAFTKQAFLSGPRQGGVFLEVMKTKVDAAPQAAMLLQSCMSELGQQRRLTDSLSVMSDLSALLQEIEPRMPAPIPAPISRTPSSPDHLEKPKSASKEPPDLPGPPARIDSGTVPRSIAAFAPLYAPNGDDFPPPPKPASGPRSASPSPQPAGLLRTPFTPQASSRQSPLMSDLTLHDLIGDPEQQEQRVALVAPSVCVFNIPHRANARDLCQAAGSFSGLLHTEVHPKQCCILQFSCMAAAVSCFEELERLLDRLGWKSARAVFAAQAATAVAARPEDWMFVPCKPSRYAFEGIMHVLHSSGVAAPTKYHIVASPYITGCLLLGRSLEHGNACVNHIIRWMEDLPRTQKAIAQAAADEAKAAASHRLPPAAELPPDPFHGRDFHPRTPEILWSGHIAKSDVPQCRVLISTASSFVAQECQHWPAKLDMQHRVTIPQAIDIWSRKESALRGWAWVKPDDDAVEYDNFVKYLTQRERAGIVRPKIAAEGCSTTLYLIPMTTDHVREQVGASVEGSSQLLLLHVQASPHVAG